MNDKTQTEKNTTSIELMKKDLSYMVKGIDDLKKLINDMRTEFLDGFVSNEKFNGLKEDVDDLKRMKDWAIKLVIGAIIMALLALLGLRTI